jgi:predicted CXXCH cytochrome family protein
MLFTKNETRRIAAVATLVLQGGIIAGCGGESPSAPTAPPGAIADAVPRYVGSKTCAGCHDAEAALWAGSHHALAMQRATEATVLGDFDSAEIEYAGKTTTFYREGDAFMARTEGADGQPGDFRVTHTFGISPLQQYLVAMPGGRRHALPIAWDSRPLEAGGQRWFHLQPGEDVDSEDPLHWTGITQNWNSFCAECHSTDLEKNYDVAGDRYSTTFAEVSTGCEACHGPGSLHAADPAVAAPALPGRSRSWTFTAGDNIAHREPAATPADAEIGVCAQCHARRSQLSDAFDPGDDFLAFYRPALLDESLYHADGQIDDEVYVYGSFLQSRMAAAGVTCSDCHEPHSASLRAEGNAVCARCHLATAYDSPVHHRHPATDETPGCVDCHMRSKTYMVVDPRRDHSFRVPRPDLTATIGTPNACGDCHAGRGADWAAAEVARWYPAGRHREFHYGQAIHAGRQWATDRAAALQRVFDDAGQPAIVRATALALLGRQVDPAVVARIDRGLRDDATLVRVAALELLPALPPEDRQSRATRYLDDPNVSIRIAAVQAIIGMRSQLPAARVASYDRALRDYIASLSFNADRAEGLNGLAILAADLGDGEKAVRYLQTTIERQPLFAPSYANLADVYRLQGRNADAVRVLEAGLARVPDDAGLVYALALAHVRDGETNTALDHLERAVRLAPEDPLYAYAYGVALNSLGRSTDAIEALSMAHERFPGHRDLLIALITILRDAGDTGRALAYLELLREAAPSEPAVEALARDLTRNVPRAP